MYRERNYSGEYLSWLIYLAGIVALLLGFLK
jgi:hypothetical protein